MALFVVAAASWALLPGRALGQPAPAPAPCDAWRVEYALAGSLELTDTPLGQGDGVHPVGPGTLVLRFENHGGQPGGRVKLVSYEMRQAFQVAARTLFGKTTVTTDATTRKAPDCGLPGEGLLDGRSLGWSAQVGGFRTDGFLTCEGTFCGKFGAPPAGRSALTTGPDAVQFMPFLFSADMKTFTMASTLVARSDSPKQTSHLVLAGRETARTCADAKTCR
jgi:hypothetical protein